MKKIFFILILSFFVTGCDYKEEIVEKEYLSYKDTCENGYYLTVSDISYSPKISFCCREIDREKIAKYIVECNKSTLNNVNANTKNQDYHEIPKSCARAVMQAYCTLPTNKQVKEIRYEYKRV